MISVRDGDVILFQGDSITDTGRADSPDGLGFGYVSAINGLLGSDSAALRVKILNRSVGGDRTTELLVRWKADCEDIKPRVLSIMIGVNDVWRIVGKWKRTDLYRSGDLSRKLPEASRSVRLPRESSSSCFAARP